MSTREEFTADLTRVIEGFEKVYPLFADLPRDTLLELWRKQNAPVDQYAIKVALAKQHSTTVPLYPYEVKTEQQAFCTQPDSVMCEVEQLIRSHVEADGKYIFQRLADEWRFDLDADTKQSLIDRRVSYEMSQNGYRYWQSLKHG